MDAHLEELPQEDRAPDPTNSSQHASLSNLSYFTGSDDGSGEVGQEQDEEHRDVCRICRCAAELPDRRLYHPCKCSGSIKYVHQDCLLQWLSHSKRRHCEVCNYEFNFTPIYSTEVPPVLSTTDILHTMSDHVWGIGKVVLRLILVIGVWLVILPIITAVLSRLAFCRSFNEAWPRATVPMGALDTVSDCLQGSIISMIIIIGFALAVSLRDFLKGYFQDVRLDPRLRAGAPRVPLAQEWNALRNAVAQPPRRDNREPLERLLGIPVMGEAEQEAAGQALLNAMIRDERPPPDVALEEVVGLQGPLRPMAENAITVAIFNALMLVAGVFLPYTIGRTAAGIAIQANNACALQLKSVEWLEDITRSVWNETQESDMLLSKRNSVIQALLGLRIDDLDKNGLPADEVLDWTHLLIGYCVLLCALLVSMVLREARRIWTPHGQLWWATVLRQTTEQALRALSHFVEGLREIAVQLLIVFKVLLVLVVERGVLPLLLGAWLDICCLPLMNCSPKEHLDLVIENSAVAACIFWFVGLLYMLYTSWLSSILQGAILPVQAPQEIQWIIMPADDDDADFLRVLVEEPVLKQLNRMLGILLLHALSLVILIHLPLQAVNVAFKGHFPLQQRLRSPSTEISMDVLLFHVIVPLALEHVQRVGNTRSISSFVQASIRLIAEALGLTEMLRERPEENNRNIPPDAVPGGQQEERDQQVPGEGPAGAAPAEGEEREQQQPEELPNAMGGAVQAVQEGGEDPVAWLRPVAMLLFSFVREHLGHGARCSLAVLTGLLALLSIHGGTLFVPVATGRAVIVLMGGPGKGHDVYSCVVGAYVLFASRKASRAVWRLVQDTGTLHALAFVFRWLKLMLQATFVFVVVVGICPLLVGMLLELLILPIRVGASKSPVMFLYQDWVLGLLCVKLWHRAIMVDPALANRQPQQPPPLPLLLMGLGLVPPAPQRLQPELPPAPADPANGGGAPRAAADDAGGGAGAGAAAAGHQNQGGRGAADAIVIWREAFLKLQRGTLCEETLHHAWNNIAVPMLLNLLTVLALPYGIARAIVPALGVLPIWALPLVEQYCYHAAAAVLLLFAGLDHVNEMTSNIHDTIRDQRFLVGQQLIDFQPEGTGARGGQVEGEQEDENEPVRAAVADDAAIGQRGAAAPLAQVADD